MKLKKNLYFYLRIVEYVVELFYKAMMLALGSGGRETLHKRGGLFERII
jgi:hypothetical protein